MDNKSNTEWWVVSLIVLGILFVAFGVYNFQAGSSLQDAALRAAEGLGPWSDWQQTAADFQQFVTIQEQYREGTSQKTGGTWLTILGSVFAALGAISLGRKKT